MGLDLGFGRFRARWGPPYLILLSMFPRVVYVLHCGFGGGALGFERLRAPAYPDPLLYSFSFPCLFCPLLLWGFLPYGVCPNHIFLCNIPFFFRHYICRLSFVVVYVGCGCFFLSSNVKHKMSLANIKLHKKQWHIFFAC